MALLLLRCPAEDFQSCRLKSPANTGSRTDRTGRVVSGAGTANGPVSIIRMLQVWIVYLLMYLFNKAVLSRPSFVRWALSGPADAAAFE